MLDLLSRNGVLRDVKLARGSTISQLTGPLVISVQDVHGRREAQRRIAGILLDLWRHDPSIPVHLEGTAGEIPINNFRSPSPRINNELGSFFLNSQLLTGAEAAGVMAPHVPSLIGVEERDLYLSNVSALKKALYKQPQAIERLAQEEKILQELKNKIYSPDLLEMDRATREYHRGSIKLGEYLARLDTSGVSRQKYPVIALFRATWEKERALNFEEVEKERARFLTHLVSRLNTPEAHELMRKSAALQSGELPYPAYYLYLKELAASKDMPLSSVPALQTYITYVLQSDAINPDVLLPELSDYEREAWKSLCKSAGQRALAEQGLRHLLMNKMVRLTLTWQEWTSLRREPVKMDYQPFVNFYRLAERRNLAFLNQTFSKGVSVLVAGGFHSEGIRSLLAEKNISVVTVTPKLTAADSFENEEYLSVFTRQKTPLEKLFEAPQISIVQTLATNPIGENPVSSVVRQLSADLPRTLSSSLETNTPVTERSPMGYEISVAPVGTSLPSSSGERVLQSKTDQGTRIAISKTADETEGDNIPEALFQLLPRWSRVFLLLFAALIHPFIKSSPAKAIFKTNGRTFYWASTKELVQEFRSLSKRWPFTRKHKTIDMILRSYVDSLPFLTSFFKGHFFGSLREALDPNSALTIPQRNYLIRHIYETLFVWYPRHLKGEQINNASPIVITMAQWPDLVMYVVFELLKNKQQLGEMKRRDSVARNHAMSLIDALVNVSLAELERVNEEGILNFNPLVRLHYYLSELANPIYRMEQAVGEVLIEWAVRKERGESSREFIQSIETPYDSDPTASQTLTINEGSQVAAEANQAQINQLKLRALLRILRPIPPGSEKGRLWYEPVHQTVREALSADIVTFDPYYFSTDPTGSDLSPSRQFQLDWISNMAQQGARHMAFVSTRVLFRPILEWFVRHHQNATPQAITRTLQAFFDDGGEEPLRSYFDHWPAAGSEGEPVELQQLVEFLEELAQITGRTQVQVRLFVELGDAYAQDTDKFKQWISGLWGKRIVFGAIGDDARALLRENHRLKIFHIAQFISDRQSELAYEGQTAGSNGHEFFRQAVVETMRRYGMGERRSVAVRLGNANTRLVEYVRDRILANPEDQLGKFVYQNDAVVVTRDDRNDGSSSMAPDDPLGTEINDPAGPVLVGASHSNQILDLLTEQRYALIASLPLLILAFAASPLQFSPQILIVFAFPISIAVLYFPPLLNHFLSIHDAQMNRIPSLFPTDADKKSYRSYLSAWYGIIGIMTLTFMSASFLFFQDHGIFSSEALRSLMAVAIGQAVGIATHAISWWKFRWRKVLMASAGTAAQPPEPENLIAVEGPNGTTHLDFSEKAADRIRQLSDVQIPPEKARRLLREAIKKNVIKGKNIFDDPQSGPLLFWVIDHAFDPAMWLSYEESIILLDQAANYLINRENFSDLDSSELAEIYCYCLLKALIRLHSIQVAYQTRSEDGGSEEEYSLLADSTAMFIGKLTHHWTAKAAVEQMPPFSATLEDYFFQVGPSQPDLSETLSYFLGNKTSFASMSVPSVRQSLMDLGMVLSEAAGRGVVTGEENALDAITALSQRAREEESETLGIQMSEMMELINGKPSTQEDEIAWNEPIQYLVEAIDSNAEIVTLEPFVVRQDGSTIFQRSLGFQLDWLGQMAQKGFKDWVISDDFTLGVVAMFLSNTGNEQTLRAVRDDLQAYITGRFEGGIRAYLGISTHQEKETEQVKEALNFYSQLRIMGHRNGVKITLFNANDLQAGSESPLQLWIEKTPGRKKLIMGIALQQSLAIPLNARSIRYLMVNAEPPNTGHVSFDDIALKAAAYSKGTETGWGEYLSAAVPINGNRVLYQFLLNRPSKIHAISNYVDTPYTYTDYHSIVFISTPDDDTEGGDDSDDDESPILPDGDPGLRELDLVSFGSSVRAAHSGRWTDLLTEQGFFYIPVLPLMAVILISPTGSLPMVTFIPFLAAFMGYVLMDIQSLGEIWFLLLHKSVPIRHQNLFRTPIDHYDYLQYLRRWYKRIGITTLTGTALTYVIFQVFFEGMSPIAMAILSFVAGQLTGIMVHGVNWIWPQFQWKSQLKASHSQKRKNYLIPIQGTTVRFSLRVLRGSYFQYRRVTDKPFSMKQGHAILTEYLRNPDAPMSQRKQGRFAFWAMKYLFHSSLALSQEERKGLQRFLSNYASSTFLSEKLSDYMADQLFYALIQLILMEFKINQQLPEPEKEANAAWVRSSYKAVITRLEDMYMIGYIPDPKRSLENLLFEIPNEEGNLKKAIGVLLRHWNYYAKRTEWAHDVLTVPSSMKSQKAASNEDEMMETIRQSQRRQILMEAVAPKSVREEKAWYRPIEYVEERAQGADVAILETYSSGHAGFLDLRITRSLQFQLDWLRQMARQDFREWAISPARDMIEPIVDAMREDMPQDHGTVQSIVGAIEEYLNSNATMGLKTWLGITKATDKSVDRAVSYWEQARVIARSTRSRVTLFINLKSPVPSEWHHFSQWFQNKPDGKRLIMGEINRMDFQRGGAPLSMVRFIQVKVMSPHRGREPRDLYELAEAVGLVGRSQSWGMKKVAALPFDAGSKALSYMRTANSPLYLLFISPKPPLDTLVITQDDEDGNYDRREIFQPEPATSLDPDDSDVLVGAGKGGGVSSFQSDSLNIVTRKLAGPIQRNLLSGFDFGNTKRLLRNTARRIAHRARRPFYAHESARNIGTVVVNVFHTDALIDPAYAGTPAAKETMTHLLKRIETVRFNHEAQPDVLVVRSEEAGETAVQRLESTLLQSAGPALATKVTAYLRRAVIVVMPAGMIEPDAVMDAALKTGKIKSGLRRLDFYTATPDQIDGRYCIISFIVFALLGNLRVQPVSEQLENNRKSATHA